MLKTLEIDAVIQQIEDQLKGLEGLQDVVSFDEMVYLRNAKNMSDSMLVEMRKDRGQKIEKLREKLLELRTERALLLDKGWYTPNKRSVKASWSDSITLDANNQTIYIGEKPLSSFEDVFDYLRIKTKGSTKKSQTKWWVCVLYATARYEEEKWYQANMLISELLEYIKEFRQKWDLWEWGNRGIAKKSISKTDCQSVDGILRKCDIKRRIKLSDGKKEIIITK